MSKADDVKNELCWKFETLWRFKNLVRISRRTIIHNFFFCFPTCSPVVAHCGFNVSWHLAKSSSDIVRIKQSVSLNGGGSPWYATMISLTTVLRPVTHLIKVKLIKVLCGIHSGRHHGRVGEERSHWRRCRAVNLKLIMKTCVSSSAEKKRENMEIFAGRSDAKIYGSLREAFTRRLHTHRRCCCVICDTRMACCRHGIVESHCRWWICCWSAEIHFGFVHSSRLAGRLCSKLRHESVELSSIFPFVRTMNWLN